MKKETERIWSPLDVHIVWIDSIESDLAAPPNGLLVMLEEGAYPISWVTRDPVLAALSQPPDSCGRGVAHVWVRHIEDHTALVRRDGHAFATLPGALGDMFLGRALGRALAHEIGHYLLGTTNHSERGLMRAQFTPEDLLQEAGQPLYGLDSRERSALMACRTGDLADRLSISEGPDRDVPHDRRDSRADRGRATGSRSRHIP
jgi:hypothetical protein